MKIRIATMFKIAAALLVALLVTAVAVIYNLDLGAYKADITAAVKDATGRELVIEGDFRPRLGLTPAVAVDRVRFANAPWGSRPDMAKIESFRAEIELLPILLGELRIKRVVLVGADILLETKADGGGNWVMGAPDAAPAEPSTGGPGTIPTVHLVSIEKSRLVYRNGRTGRSTVFKVDRLRARAENAGAPLKISFRGAYDKAPVNLDGTVGSLAKVISGTDALPFDFTASAGGARIAAKGVIAKPLEAKGISIAVSAEGEDLAALTPLAGQKVPSVGPWRLAATVSDAARGWALKEIAASVGRSSLLGEATVDPTAQPPVVTARLTAPLLRMYDFQDRDRKPPPDVPATAEARVFPADPLPLGGLGAVDAKVTFRATRIEAPGAVLSDVAADLALAGGRLDIKPARLKYAGGTVGAEVALETAGKTPTVAVRFDALGLDLAALVKDAGRPGLITGKLDVGGDVQGQGNSVRAIMAALDGKLAVTMNEGRLQDELFDLASADLLKLISPFGSREKGIGINCLVGRYDVKRGNLRSLVTFFDTTRASVRGNGGASLADETLDFTLVPHAKEASVMALMVPIRIDGRFAAPSVYPDPGGVAKSAVGVVAGVALGPIGMIGSVIGGVIGDGAARPSSTAANNPCMAALSDKPPAVGTAPGAAPSGTPAPSSPADGVGRALEGIGEGIDKGLKSLFGK